MIATESRCMTLSEHRGAEGRGRMGQTDGPERMEELCMEELRMEEPRMAQDLSPPNFAYPQLFPAYSLQSAPSEDLPDLPDDVLIEVLHRLDGNNRSSVQGCCTRLRTLAHATFTKTAIPVPAAAAAAALSEPQHAMQLSRLLGMSTIVLQLPPLPAELTSPPSSTTLSRPLASSSSQTPAAAAAGGACPHDSLDLFLQSMLDPPHATPGPPPQLQVEHLRLCTPAQDASSVCQVGHGALARLAACSPRLRRLSLPLLSAESALALPLFSRTLTTLSVTIHDGTTLDHVLKLKQLQQLRLSTRKGL